MLGRPFAIGLVLSVAILPAQADDGTFRLTNGLVYREIVIDRGILRTTGWGRETTPKDSIRTLDTTKEFQVDGLTNRDYRASLAEQNQPPDHPLSEITFDLTPIEPNHPELRVKYLAVPGKTLLRKTIEMQARDVIEKLDVESLDLARGGVGGGLGQPITIADAWFVGIEYPAGHNRIDGPSIRCGHFPSGRVKQSKTAVLGSGAENEPIREAFLRYVDQHRPRRGPFLLYSSWFDRRQHELTPEACLSTFDSLQKNLLAPYGLTLDAFLVDDGYQKRDSLWQTAPQWPGGLASLAIQLQKKGSHLGIWMPLNGLGLDPSFGQKQGWKLAHFEDKNFYSLADEKYLSAIRGVIDQWIDNEQITCLKHDFNFFDAILDDGPATPDTRREAITDSTIRLLEETRRKRPGIFLSLTSGVNLSPWWLWYADTLWMGYGDYNHDRSFAQSTSRQEEMTYRDEKLYRRLRIENVPIPPSALMTHGIIRGRLDETNPQTTDADWNDYVVMTLGRGTELQELYLSPEVMVSAAGKPLGWHELGIAIRWARSHAGTLAHTVMVGGHPGQGEAYGYAHWSEDLGIVVYRNPTIVPREVLITTAERPFHQSRHSHWTPIVVYPHQQRFADLDATSALRLRLPGQSVTVVHLYSEPPSFLRDIPVGRFRFDKSKNEISILSTPVVSIAAKGEVIDDQTTWKGTFRLAGDSLSPVSLSVVTEPPAGISMTIPKAQPVLRKQAPTWQLTEYAINGREIPLGADILPTPLYPEQSRATAVLRAGVTCEVIETKSIAVGDIPDWPALDDRGSGSIHDHVLFENRLFTRGRKLIERALWWVLLVALPIGLICQIKLTRPARWRWALTLLIRLILLGLVSVIYLQSPVSAWLMNLLMEEM
jgi:hypothetical protein